MAQMKMRVLLVCVVAAFSVGCSTRIQPGYVGITVNASGTNRGVGDYPITTGRVWYNPLTTTVLEWPTFVQNAAWTHDVNEGKAVNEEISFTTADQMSVSADISIGYSLTAERVPHFYVKFRTDDVSSFTHGFLRNLTREKFDKIAGHYKIEQIMGDNGPFLDEVRAAVQKDIEPYGVKIEQFGLIGAPRPPASVIESINMKVKATQIAIQTQNEVATAVAEANKLVAQADGYARSTAIHADADAAYNRKVAESLTPLLVQNRSISQWDGHLPQVSGGAMPFINIPIGK
jgi:regulator of protease activity HflC (stomatin/prohibitin superfamily)